MGTYLIFGCILNVFLIFGRRSGTGKGKNYKHDILSLTFFTFNNGQNLQRYRLWSHFRLLEMLSIVSNQFMFFSFFKYTCQGRSKSKYLIFCINTSSGLGVICTTPLVKCFEVQSWQSEIKYKSDLSQLFSIEDVIV